MYNILVVDDDKEIVKAIEIYLEKENSPCILYYFIQGEFSVFFVKRIKILFFYWHHFLYMQIWIIKIHGILI